MRHRRFYRLEDRDSFLLSHVMVREVLAGYDGIPALSRLIQQREHGKPYIAPACNPTALEFNLSHSGDWAVLLVARGVASVGVDVEQHRPDRDLGALARRNFAAAENLQFEALGGGATPAGVRAFFDFWSLKEAFVKAHGRGIALGLGRFSFSLGGDDPERPPFAADAQVEPDPQRWHFRLCRGLSDYSVALAADQQPGSLAFLGFDPLNHRTARFGSLADATDYQQ